MRDDPRSLVTRKKLARSLLQHDGSDDDDAEELPAPGIACAGRCRSLGLLSLRLDGVRGGPCHDREAAHSHGVYTAIVRRSVPMVGRRAPFVGVSARFQTGERASTPVDLAPESEGGQSAGAPLSSVPPPIWSEGLLRSAGDATNMCDAQAPS
jgi:hypothetical protein